MRAIGEKEENFVLVDRRKKEKSFHAGIAKAKFHIQYRHDKVPAGSFPYSTRQNCNRMKTSADTAELIHTDTIELCLAMFGIPHTAEFRSRSRENSIMSQITPLTSILR